jgi:pyruvyltransferase
LDEILSCEVILTSALHPWIVADAYGIPVVLLESTMETRFKYQDYALATGRELPLPVCYVKPHNINPKYLAQFAIEPTWDEAQAQALLDSFPKEVF